jgi:hypothetical protein
MDSLPKCFELLVISPELVRLMNEGFSGALPGGASPQVELKEPSHG